MKIYGLDPGPVFSALVALDAQDGRVLSFSKKLNVDLHPELKTLPWSKDDVFGYEMIASYGMAVGKEVFETCVWIGRFIEVVRSPSVRALRKEIVLHHCNSPRGNDSALRQALLDRYGGKETALGNKKSPGPLFGITGDCWSALGVATYVRDLFLDGKLSFCETQTAEGSVAPLGDSKAPVPGMSGR